MSDQKKNLRFSEDLENKSLVLANQQDEQKAKEDQLKTYIILVIINLVVM